MEKYIYSGFHFSYNTIKIKANFDEFLVGQKPLLFLERVIYVKLVFKRVPKSCPTCAKIVYEGYIDI